MSWGSFKLKQKTDEQSFALRGSTKEYPLLASGSPPGKPPRKPNMSSDPIFDGFPPIETKEAEKVIEQTVVHLLWDNLEKSGFNIYPEQFIARNKRIDLIVTKGKYSIGIEVKCKAELETRDIKQILSYKEILSEKGIPLVAFWVPTAGFSVPISDYELKETATHGHNFEVVHANVEEEDIKKVMDSLFIGFIQMDDSSNITLSRVLLKSDPRTYTHFPTTRYFVSRFVSENLTRAFHKKLRDSTERSYANLTLQRKREIEIEHKLWKFLRDHKYKVLCQYPIRLDKNHKRRIDLIGVANHYDSIIPHRKVGIEVKQKLTKKGITQAAEYNYQLMYEGIRTYIGIPPQGIPKKFQTFKRMVNEIEENQLGLTLIDPHTTIVEFYDPPFSEPEIKEIFTRYAERGSKGTRRLTEYGIKIE